MRGDQRLLLFQDHRDQLLMLLADLHQVILGFVGCSVEVGPKRIVIRQAGDRNHVLIRKQSLRILLLQLRVRSGGTVRSHLRCWLVLRLWLLRKQRLRYVHSEQWVLYEKWIVLLRNRDVDSIVVGSRVHRLLWSGYAFPLTFDHWVPSDVTILPR